MDAGTDLRFPSSRWLLLIGGVLLACVLVLGAHVQSVRGPIRTDVRVQRQLPQPAESTMHRVAAVGSELPVVATVVALTAWAATRRDWPGVAVALVAPTVALFLTEYVLKPLVDRTSAKGALSYPSGHAAVVSALASVAVLFVYRYVGPRFALLWSPYALAIVGAVAFAVVALRWHYITDSIGGVGLGLAVVLLVAPAADTIRSTTRWTPRRPTSTSTTGRTS